MKLGIFAKTFNRPTLEGVLDAVSAHGLTEVQFNLVCAGLPTVPRAMEPRLAGRIRNAFAARGLNMAALSGTFNLIHPDLEQRDMGFEGLAVLAENAAALGTSVITLCTGTRHPTNMWGAHPDNGKPEAWAELLGSMERALRIAERTGVTLAVEPEVSSVMDSAASARRLLDHFRSPLLKAVMDPANLFPAGQIHRMREIIGEAFGLLAGDIVLAHAKDLSGDGEAGHEAAGTGLLDYDFYLAQLKLSGFAGPLILHGLAESQVDGCVRFLREKAKNCGSSCPPETATPSIKPADENVRAPFEKSLC